MLIGLVNERRAHPINAAFARSRDGAFITQEVGALDMAASRPSFLDLPAGAIQVNPDYIYPVFFELTFDIRKKPLTGSLQEDKLFER